MIDTSKIESFGAGLLASRTQVGEQCLAAAAGSAVKGDDPDRFTHASDAISDILTAMYGPAGTNSDDNPIAYSRYALNEARALIEHAINSYEGDAEDYRLRSPDEIVDCPCGAGPFDSWDGVLAHASQWHPDRMPSRPGKPPATSRPAREALAAKLGEVVALVVTDGGDPLDEGASTTDNLLHIDVGRMADGSDRWFVLAHVDNVDGEERSFRTVINHDLTLEAYEEN